MAVNRAEDSTTIHRAERKAKELVEKPFNMTEEVAKKILKQQRAHRESQPLPDTSIKTDSEDPAIVALREKLAREG